MPLQTIIDKTDRIATDYPEEKVYIHFDKPYYTVADTIWFKTYLVQSKNIPSSISKVVYVEFFNSQDSLFATLKLPVNNSVAYGHFPLNANVFKQGNYYVRAYTNWMLNFDEKYFFTKNIVLGETIQKQVLTNVTYSTSSDGKKTNVKISYKNLEGKPIVNKNVSWQFVNNFDVVETGNANTDQAGFVNIVLNTQKEANVLNQKSTLQTKLNYAEKEEPAFVNFDLASAIRKNDTQFFPEGGDLIAGLPIQIAFKSIQSNGLGIASKGVILDEKNEKISDFSSVNLGMGSFFLNPEVGKSYKAALTYADGTQQTLNLPEVKNEGITLQINNNNEHFIQVKVLASEAYFQKNKNKGFYLLGQNGGNVYFAAQAALNKQTFMVKVSKSKFPMGIVQFVLFSSDAKPLSERLVFVKNKAKLNLVLAADKPFYAKKQKVKLTIKAQDSLQVSLANLSMSVIDESKVPSDENKETTILSSLLLSSDLKGYIEQPNSYFTQVSEKKNTDLDLLMRTQGYRRFNYDEILNNKYPEVLVYPEKGIEVRGTLRTAVGTPINKGTVLLTIPDKRYNKQITTSAMGVFSFKDLVFNDSTKVTVNAKYNPNPNNILIMIDGFPAPTFGSNKQKADEVLNIDTTLNKYLSNSQKQYRFLNNLKEVKVVGQKVKKPSHSDHSALSTLSIADHELNAESLSGCNFLLECLKTRLVGVTFFENNFFVSRNYNQGNKVPMQIFLNGMPVDVNAINTVNYSDLSSVETFLRDNLGTIDRAYGTNGVLVINTKKIPKSKGTKMTREQIENLLPKNNVITFSPIGYTKEREFYTPKYTVDNSNVSDLRTTIYWNPKIETDANGMATVEFFNADGKGNYKVIVEGIDANGNVGRSVMRYVLK
ncbi:MAG: carboxypeptidase regulatory-like domain-containing protein [Sphingobacteriaceae bacterium]|nr:carboxypeptidase regulatory-like domain-containing protein [Sphingobacteriaceae bacterium]